MFKNQSKNFPILCFLLLFSSCSFADQAISVKSSPFQTAVVELYTSEGCSSCPPADRWLNQLIQIKDDELNVLALAFHVDYWDYIGWKDEFANPRYTNRQRKLARRNSQSTIYTPGFFVDGMETRGTMSILNKIRQVNKNLSPVNLTLTIHPTQSLYRLELLSYTDTDQSLTVQFVIFENELSNQVERGENAGKQLEHQRVVRHLSPTIELKSSMQYEIPRDPTWQEENLGIAAIIKTTDEDYIQSIYSLLAQSSP
jgi:hypothetical protein